jgi:murein tripeptide amidase MpaA
VSIDIRFDRYYPFRDLTERLQALVSAYPQLLQLDSIGKSYEGRDVWCVTATNIATGPAFEKPAFWCDGNIHATEVSASSACLYLLHKLAIQYGHDEQVTRALNTRVFYVVPRVNPDGAELYFAGRPRYIRSSTRAYPYDEEPLEGLQQEDVDGDGRILQMRIEDPNGPWKRHPEHPRLMVRRDPVETGGPYYRILPEGTLENWDGVTLTVKSRKEGLDLNRNFPAYWRQEGEQHGAGPFPGSEPEVANLLRFITSHPNITGGLTFHTHSGVLLRPYHSKGDEAFPAEDLWTYQAIGKRGAEITGYPAINGYQDFRDQTEVNVLVTGLFDEWMYEHIGVYGWTVEIWSPQRQAGLSEGLDAKTKPGSFRVADWYRDHPLEDDLKMIEWSDTKLAGRGYIDWYPFKHPQLGQVELGGWDFQYAFRNPPLQFLENEIAPLADWAIWHALISPRLELHSAAAKPLGQGTYMVQLVVDNTGWLPTYVTKKALEKKAVRGLVAEIQLPAGATLESGKERVEIGQLEGRAYKSSSPYGRAEDPTQERAKVEWVIRAQSCRIVRLTVRHERAGTVRAEVTLI